MSESHEKYMRLALEEARLGVTEGEEPFGAVVVRQGTVIAKAHSLKVGSFDTTAHAETRAVGMATRFLKRRDLSDCVFYSVCEPCPMCAGAMINAHLGTLVLGARVAALRASLGGEAFMSDYSVDGMLELTNSDMKLMTGILDSECSALYLDLRVGQTSR